MKTESPFTKLQMAHAELFKSAMIGASILHNHILQNIPAEVYAEAMLIYTQGPKNGEAWLKQYMDRRNKEINQ